MFHLSVWFKCEALLVVFAGLFFFRLVVHSSSSVSPAPTRKTAATANCYRDGPYFLVRPPGKHHYPVAYDIYNYEVPNDLHTCVDRRMDHHVDDHVDASLHACACEWANGDKVTFAKIRETARRQTDECMKALHDCMRYHKDEDVSSQKDLMRLCVATEDEQFTERYFCQFEVPWLYRTWSSNKK